MDLSEIYKQLSDVDIEDQKRIWYERGKGYYGEYLVFCQLYKGLAGSCKILMNLNIPIHPSGTTEIDLLLIHETGLYVFEIKHYQGTIYGKDTDKNWTQYFRTVRNGVFKNPIEQNGFHIRALKQMFPDIPMRSCVVFTNDDCDIRVNNSNPEIVICKLKKLLYVINDVFVTQNVKYSMEEIDKIFQKLSVYSPMKEKVKINDSESDFFSWIQPTIKGLEKAKEDVLEEKEKLQLAINNQKEIEIKTISKELEKAREDVLKEKEKLQLAINNQKKIKIKTILICVLVTACFLLISVMVVFLFRYQYDNAVKENNAELAEFKQNFLHVDQINNEYIDELNDFVEVSNVSINQIADNVVSFTARIGISSNAYDSFGISLTENSKYIVITKSGQVFEYDVFGEHLSYSRYSNTIGKGYRSYGDLAVSQFYGVNEDDISYIKITNINLYKTNSKYTLIKDKLEIELYSK